ncbi:enoyl-CoA hydratase/isomerase family protein [Pseudomonas aeruginosa]|uniref:enoyl-CoA hydratase/isomerase family protein n=1 Tax=Pseudomonas aeruginosa TaxID=287 RepID=UPI000B50461E|nr:enoyl-CoA hydratase/isomerase family protein [Pseudomonas aeruginosa]ASD11725.1 crotonase [Pseudomonas aeruginosa]
MSGDDQAVIATVRNRVGHLTLNRPQGLNALTLPMIRALSCHLHAWAQDSEVLAVVLRGAGEKAFCAGGDIRSLYESHAAGDDLHQRFFDEEYQLDQCIHTYRKPILALMDGLVLGGGMGLAQGAALRVISERVKMAMPEVGIGFYPDVGGSYFLSHLLGELGTYLGVTGIQLRAADALHARLADWCLPSEQFEEFDRCLDNLNWTTPAHESLRTLLGTLASNRITGAELRALQPAIDEHFSKPDIAAIRESLLSEARVQFQDWADETVKLMDSRSPLAMAVTLELIRRGRDASLADCFALETHLGRQWFAKGDIMEGVRALIIDKDKQPRWSPATIQEVKPEQVSDFFAGWPAIADKKRKAPMTAEENR